MTNYCYYSMRLNKLLSFRWTNCRNLCTICKYKQNSIKYLNNNNIIETNLKSRNYWFSASLLFRNNLKPFQSKNSFSTTFPRNERLSQIYRNVIKEKTQNSEPINEWQELMKMSLFKRFKVMFKKYWYISIPVHCVTSGLWFGFLYLIAKSGFDVKPLLEKIKPFVEKSPLPEFIKKPLTSDHNSASVGYLAIALLLYKLVTPARYAVTVFTSIYAIKYFVQRGLIKAAPTGHQIRAQVIRSRAQLNKVLRDRLEKREQLRRIKTKHKPKS